LKELALAAILAQAPMPDDMYPIEVPFQLACTPSFASMMEHLEKDYGEIPMVMSHMSVDTTIVLFVNKEQTTSTLVVTRSNKDREEACILWGGQSNGTSLSINPNPVYPEERT